MLTIVWGAPPVSAMASLVISPSIASIGWMMMLTANVAATPAKPAARPAIGLRFRLANAAAASGIRIRYPASEATLDSPPTRMIKNAISLRGATATSLRIKAPISPAASARPAPIMAMNVTAMTPKFWKLGTNDVNRKRMPSIVRRPLIGMVSSWGLKCVSDHSSPSCVASIWICVVSG